MVVGVKPHPASLLGLPGKAKLYPSDNSWTAATLQSVPESGSRSATGTPHNSPTMDSLLPVTAAGLQILNLYGYKFPIQKSNRACPPLEISFQLFSQTDLGREPPAQRGISGTVTLAVFLTSVRTGGRLKHSRAGNREGVGWTSEG